eukprot:CAMPEP_0181086294 /NCGR_PEP_ID=MMETSP1071-20121207/5671_1 /TAXON_ID=35127 /ORGANISM="Thalassiosira sp., Strain NH16" /LENGTH=240 /DNA_ID=CAMNT_0023168123 /DNA_START=70 /DNA_END=788 /DNA_ORIENTATION=-
MLQGRHHDTSELAMIVLFAIALLPSLLPPARTVARAAPDKAVQVSRAESSETSFPIRRRRIRRRPEEHRVNKGAEGNNGHGTEDLIMGPRYDEAEERLLRHGGRRNNNNGQRQGGGGATKRRESVGVGRRKKKGRGQNEASSGGRDGAKMGRTAAVEKTHRAVNGNTTKRQRVAGSPHYAKKRANRGGGFNKKKRRHGTDSTVAVARHTGTRKKGQNRDNRVNRRKRQRDRGGKYTSNGG